MLQPPSLFGRTPDDKEPADDESKCPITHEMMKDPVVAADGYTYERAAIQQSLDSGNPRSPSTNLHLVNWNLTPNLNVKSRITKWVQSNQGKSGLEKKILKELTQLFFSESHEDAFEALEKVMSLVSKYEIFLPFLTRKIEVCSAEWVDNEVLQAQFQQMLQLCDKRERLFRGKLQSICEVRDEAAKQEQAKGHEITELKENIKKAEEALKQQEREVERLKRSLAKLQHEKEQYAKAKAASSEQQENLQKSMERVEENGCGGRVGQKRKRMESDQEQARTSNGIGAGSGTSGSESTLEERAKALYEEGLATYYGYNFKRIEQTQGMLMVTVAAKNGLKLAIADCMRYGWSGTEKDEKAAFDIYKAEAATGSAIAQNNFGLLYSRGVGKDVAAAVEWYRKAAEQGNARAQLNLGHAYGSGQGVDEDKAVAVEWYRKAAEQGYVSAQAMLGFSYFNGQGVDEDKAVAVGWFRKAAEQGYAAARCFL